MMANGLARAAQTQKTPTQRWQLIGVTALVLAFCGAYAVWAARDFRASRLAERSERGALQKAVALEPGNAEYTARLGRYELLLAQSPKAAIVDFRHAVELNPYSAQAQLDLAAALAQAGDEAGQQRTLEAALATEPTNPHVAWTVANWSLLRGDNAAALKQFRVVVENDPEMAEAAINLAWRRTRDAATILKVCIPPAPNARLAFLEYLVYQKEPQAAATVWQAISASGERLPLRVPIQYVGWMMGQHDWAGATAAWRRLQELDPELRAYATDAGNLITNGGFEQPILNAAFDWHSDPPMGVTLETDSMALRSGARSLSIEFREATAISAGIAQYVPVEPQTHYYFRAFWKGDDLVSAAPPYWAIRDADDYSVLFNSETIVGTSGWREVRGEFITSVKTAAVEISIMRASEAPIRGRLAIDDVALSKEPLR